MAGFRALDGIALTETVAVALGVAAAERDADCDDVKADFWHVFDLPDDVEPGDAAIAEARRRAGEFAAKWQSKHPGAVACVTDDLAWLTTFLRFPRGHWRRILHTNLIERTFNQG